MLYYRQIKACKLKRKRETKTMNIIRSIDTRFKNFSIEYIVFLPIIHYKTMKVIYNPILPFKGFAAINLFGVVFARRECKPLSGPHASA